VAEEISNERLEQMRRILKGVPFAQLLGLEILAASSGSATLKLVMRPELKQNHGVMHGGAMASLIDTTTAFAIISQLREPQRFTTVDLTVNYLKAVTEGEVTCRASVIRAGRRLLTLSAEARDANGNLVAIAVSTYIKLESR
jgi:acyl-CoA thioesterase